MNKLSGFKGPANIKLSTIGYLLVASIIAIGWIQRDNLFIVAEDGLGYWLGIIGASMMLILFVYPLRKRIPAISWIGSTRIWFRLHIMLGIVGPCLIVFHSGFNLGSFNSRVAFFSMTIVVLSGLLGRILYEKIHYGLTGQKRHFAEIAATNPINPEEIIRLKPESVSVIREMEELELSLTNLHTGINRSLRQFLLSSRRLSKLNREVSRLQLDKNSRHAILERIKVLRAICSLGINEILFSYWHVLHIPLLFMLVFSAVAHVVVVHLY